MTSKARKWTHDEAQAELTYIQGINPIHPGHAFGYDRLCFASYCDMQANQANHSGWCGIADDILQSRNLANRLDIHNVSEGSNHVYD